MPLSADDHAEIQQLYAATTTPSTSATWTPISPAPRPTPTSIGPLAVESDQEWWATDVLALIRLKGFTLNIDSGSGKVDVARGDARFLWELADLFSLTASEDALFSADGEAIGYWVRPGSLLGRDR